VHAEGERRWHARESRLARQTEPRVQTLIVSQVLRTRAHVQRRIARRASMIIAASPQFSRELAGDYGIDPDRLRVVPNPVDTDRFRPPSTPRARGAALTLLYVSRFSVRKGLELVVELSHRLNDLAGQVRVLVVGYPSPWSNYSGLLDGLNPAVGRVHGLAAPSTMAEIYRTGDALIQPSHYEPFGLSVAEALASGLPVVASRCVGAAAGVDDRCCLTFETGSIDGFEHAVRLLIKQLGEDGAAGLHAHARAEAERLFAPTRVAGELYGALGHVRAPLQSRA
jgi:glycosyltransferase involved in cell wall biosynthesis